MLIPQWSGRHRTNLSRMLEIQRTERAAIAQRAERLCSVMKARSDAVRERLGLSLQPVGQPSPQPPSVRRRSSILHDGGQRISPLLPHWTVEGIRRTQRSVDEEDDSFWDGVLLGSPMADRVQSPTTSIRSVSSLSSVDRHTPDELRAIWQIGSPVEATFTPTPPRAVPLSRSRVSRLPVLSTKLSRTGEFL